MEQNGMKRKKKAMDMTEWYYIKTFAVKFKTANRLPRIPGRKTVTEWCKRHLEPQGLAVLVKDPMFGSGRVWKISPDALSFKPPAPGPKSSKRAADLS